LHLLLDFRVYKEALADYEHQVQSPSGNYIENLQSKHDWQKRLRRQILSAATVEAFWQLDELVDDHALEKLIIRNSEYNEEEKNRQLEQLEANLPVEISDFREQLYIASNLQNEVDRYREQGGSDETVRQLRIDKVGLEAADRLDVLENNQRFWQQRIIAYGNKVKTVNNIEGLSDQDKQDQLKNYREINFKVNEQLRLEAALQLLSTKNYN
jgi:lipase chaperone LimK